MMDTSGLLPAATQERLKTGGVCWCGSQRAGTWCMGESLAEPTADTVPVAAASLLEPGFAGEQQEAGPPSDKQCVCITAIVIINLWH